MMRLRWEWLACTFAVALFVVYMTSSEVLHRVDAAIYDHLLQLDSRPTLDDIVIISIDDTSLQALGAWPWPRKYHAQMLTQLAKTKPKAVALDVLFLEPSPQIEFDEVLADALRLPGLGQVFLPVTANTPIVPGHELVWQQPIPALANAVTGLGHVNVVLDQDGIARRMQIFADKLQPEWPSLSMQLFKASGKSQINTFAQTYLSDKQAALLPFSKTAGHFRTVPYIHVLRGEVPAELLANKLILVGVTGTGLGNQYPTPHAARDALLSGVQIAATALEGLLDRSLIAQVSTSTALGLNGLFALAWMLLLYPLGPRRSIFALIMAMLGVMCVSALMLIYGRMWWPVATLSVSMLLGYLLWSWRRVSVMFMDLKSHAKKTAAEDTSFAPHLMADNQAYANEWQDILNTLDAGLQTAMLRKKRVTDTLEALPEAVLLTDASGMIKMANARACILFKTDNLVDQNALSLMTRKNGSDLHFEPQLTTGWHVFMQQHQTHVDGSEIHLSKELCVLLRSTAIENLDVSAQTTTLPPWWIVTLVDISKQKLLQRQRNDALQLLWHDLRAPQSAILTLLRTSERNEPIDQFQKKVLQEKIAAQVHETLAMTDDFVWQLQAESDVHDFQEVDMVQLINEVIDRAWPQAVAKNILLVCDPSQLLPDLANSADDIHHSLWLSIEPRLMGRAVFNLVDNAIKYSPAGTQVVVALCVKAVTNISTAIEQAPSNLYTAEITITDNGYGIATENLSKIFDAYTRFSAPELDTWNTKTYSSGGHGLGLRLVKTVVELHKGTIHCSSAQGAATVFTVTLPMGLAS